MSLLVAIVFAVPALLGLLLPHEGVETALDSRIILDQPGAEKLLGAGDGLLEDGASGTLRRFQAPFVPQDIVSRIVESGGTKALLRSDADLDDPSKWERVALPFLSPDTETS